MRHSEIETLKEIFPNWTEQDLAEILRETSSLELAIARISEGLVVSSKALLMNGRLLRERRRLKRLKK